MLISCTFNRFCLKLHNKRLVKFNICYCVKLVLKYEIYRQYIGEAGYADVQLTRNARNYSSSLDNMGAVITVFEY